MRVTIHVKPNAKQVKVEQIGPREYRVAVKAPPVEGKANAAVQEALAEHFKVPRSTVVLVHGEKGKKKVFDLKTLAAFLLFLLLTNCSTLNKLNGQKTLGYTAKPFSPHTKIFLVAGSQDSANFAQEVLDQKKLWLSRGIKPEEISCYYALPGGGWVYEDLEQFRDLAEPLSECYPASGKIIHAHLRQALATKPKFIYLYVTSHGNLPGTDDTYTLSLRSLPSGKTYFDAEARTAVERRELAFDDVVLTPAGLKRTLSVAPGTKKYVVLQGCFSGGFIEATDPKYQKDLLTSLKNLTVLTASNSDRASFGCDTGSRTTLYGESLQQVLRKHPGTPDRIDWLNLYDEVKREVLRREPADMRSSSPLYFTSKT